MLHARPFILTLALAACTLAADPLSKKNEVDFFREVPSRDLHGLATRSDGRLVAGPVLSDLKGTAPAALLWCLEPGPGGSWIVGAGPGGRILEVDADLSAGTYTSKEIVNLGDVQVYAVKALADRTLLAGSSPTGGLSLVRGGKVVARTGLPVESVFDIALSKDGASALVATGNPGRIYAVDLKALEAAGVSAERTSDPKALAARGVTLFGEVADRNLRRLVRLPDGRVVAGSAPKGNLYVFGEAGGAPYILQENRDAEVTDLLVDPKGGFYAAMVFSGGDIHPSAQNIQISGNPDGTLTVMGAGPTPGPGPIPTPAPAGAAPKSKEQPVEIFNQPAQVERFQGRSTLQWFSDTGFSDVLASRSGVAFYRLCRMGGLIVISGGEMGEMLGYDVENRLSLTFPGSASSQVNALEPVPGAPGRFIALRNNAPGLSLIDFGAATQRTAQTKRVDMGSTARLGALRFNRLRDVLPAQLSVSVRTTNGSGETDGWSPWVPMKESDGWRADAPAGRYAELRLELPAASKARLEIDRADLYFLTQNHRPQLTDFRMLSPNYAIVVPPEMPPAVVTTVGQLIQASDHDSDRRKSGFLGSQVVASPGTRVAFWTVTDQDGDNLVYTFSIRRDGDPDWTDLSVDSKDPYVQFDTLHLQEGTYFTRLVAREAAPRPAAERLSVTFETDDMVVDHTPPAILDASVRRDAGKVCVTVHGRDALSLLDSAEFTFNNGVHEVVEQPQDGILDGQEETFVLEVPADRLSSATSVEVTLYDAAGNGATRRLGL